MKIPPKRIAIIGAESTGKTTLAEALANALNCPWVAEFARDYWLTKNAHFSYEDMEFIAKAQVATEEEKYQEAIAQNAAFLICDTTPKTTLFYCLNTYQKAPDLMWQLAQRSYDLSVLCLPDFPFVQDGLRDSDAFRQKQHTWYLQQLKGKNVLHVGGKLKARVDDVLQHI